MLNKHLLRHWYERHTKQGGYVGVSFVDWNLFLKELITLLEKFKKLTRRSNGIYRYICN